MKKSLIVLTKVLLFSIPSISLHRIGCPCRKVKWHNFIDGRAHFLTSGEADFKNRAPQIIFALHQKSCPLSWFHWRRKHFTNNKPDDLSYPKQIYYVLFTVLQLLLVLQSVNGASSRTPTSHFLSTICRVEENYLYLSSLLVSCNFLDSESDKIILQLWSSSSAYRQSGLPVRWIGHLHTNSWWLFLVSLFKYVNLRWFSMCLITHGNELMCHHKMYYAAISRSNNFKQISRWLFLCHNCVFHKLNLDSLRSVPF